MVATKRRKCIYTDAGEILRAPHSTPQTIVTNWERIPVTYFGECNVAECRWHSVMTVSRTVAEETTRHHNLIHH